MVSKTLFSHDSTEWQTPKKLFDELNEEFQFELDPCTTKDNPLGTPYFYTKEDNGLNKFWNYGNVFVNPPYNRAISKWLDKARHEIKYGDRIEYIVFLLPARVDTKWFHKYIYNLESNAQIRFIKGRLKFTNSMNSAPFPSMIIVFSK